MKFVKEKYKKLTYIEKQKYIKFIKDKFEKELSRALMLTRVSAPIVVTKDSGLQDELSGVERSVSFDILHDGRELEIVQSLAKWKRMALKKYEIQVNEGIYTDMTAVRRDEKLDAVHSIYVDQWDWEKVILKQDRTLKYLKSIVKKIVRAICKTHLFLKQIGFCNVDICDKVFFVTSEELRQMYPTKTSKEREYEITKKYKTVFIMQIGDTLTDGKPHDLRAPDYDDWSLNGDLFFYHEVLDMALELSSMGIRVDKDSLIYQIKKSQKLEKLSYPFHQAILSGELPFSIGGGVGQSRLCQLLLGRAHIGEVQAGYWDKKAIEDCKKLEIELL